LAMNVKTSQRVNDVISGVHYRKIECKFTIALQRDQALEGKVLTWIVGILGEDHPSEDYELYIQDGSVISKYLMKLFNYINYTRLFRVMTSIVFNSVPMEDIEQNWGCNPSLDRVRSVIREIKR